MNRSTAPPLSLRSHRELLANSSAEARLLPALTSGSPPIRLHDHSPSSCGRTNEGADISLLRWTQFYAQGTGA